MTSASGKLDDPLRPGSGTGPEITYQTRITALENELAALRMELQAAQSEAALAKAGAVEDQGKLQTVTLQCQTQAALLRQRLVATARLHRELLSAHQDRIRCEQELSATDLRHAHHQKEARATLRSKLRGLIAPIRSAVAKSYRGIASVHRPSRSVDS